MLHEIEYRGLTLSIEIDENVTNIKYVKNGNNYSVDIFDRLTSKKGKTIDMPYVVNITDIEGEILNTKRSKAKLSDSYYIDYYNMPIQTGITLGQFLDRASVNVVISNIFGEKAYAFNIMKNYEPNQPIIFDLTVTNNSVDIVLVNYTDTETIEYSIDNITYQSSSLFEGLVNDDYVMYVKSIEDGYAFKKSFTINYEEEV